MSTYRGFMNDVSKAPVVLALPSGWTVEARYIEGTVRLRFEIGDATTHRETVAKLVGQMLECSADLGRLFELHDWCRGCDGEYCTCGRAAVNCPDCPDRP